MYFVECSCQDKFTCLDCSGCLPLSQVCDGKPQCNDASDESEKNCGCKYLKVKVNGSCLRWD